MKVIGLMTGTSMDGLDCCYANITIDKDFKLSYDIIDFRTFLFPENLKKSIVLSLGNKKKSIVLKTDDELGAFFLNCCKKFIGYNSIDLISIHGQTISHTNGVESIQIGSPKYLYDFFKIPIVYDFRSRDIELGGNGAPLIPFLDWLLYKDYNENVITLNIGGISNISFIPKNGCRNDVLGFDTGPGMCLIDGFANIIWNKRIDYNAEYSTVGKVNNDLLKFLMENIFVNTNPPKSTSTENYSLVFLKNIINKFNKISYNDIIRTLVNFTAKSIAFNINNFLNVNADFELFISGGGANHPLIIDDLNKNIECNRIKCFSKNNLNVNSKESFLIAVMGYTKFYNIPNNMVSVTGASKLCVYGEIYE